MILQRLVEYYDRLAAHPETRDALPAFGFSTERISFCVVIRPDSTAYLQDLRTDSRGRMLPRSLKVPHYGEKRTVNDRPFFLWDSTEYTLGSSGDSADPARGRRRFELFREFHLGFQQEIRSELFDRVCQFLEQWDPARCEDLPLWNEAVGTNLVFKIEGVSSFVHEVPSCRSAWLRFLQARDAALGRSLISGQTVPIARLHPAIKGIWDPGGQAEKGIVAFNKGKTAFASFHKEQAANAPLSAEEASKYAASLNYLLDRKLRVGDATIVFWAERTTPLEQFVSDLFDNVPPGSKEAPPEAEERTRQARLFLSQLRDGSAVGDALDDSDSTRFFILGLSPSTSRIAVRFWCDTTVRKLKGLLARHLQDTDLVGDFDEKPLTVRRLSLATGRANKDGRSPVGEQYDDKKVSPALAGSIARAILTGGPYPQTLLTSMLNRLKSDGQITHPRIAAIKACLNRNSRLRGNPLEVSVALDRNRNDAAYLSGRLFALLEKVQVASADSELNTTIKDRYFSSASMTPAVVFPRLLRLSQYHLAKLETGLKIFFDRQIGEVVGKLDGFARHFTIEQQGHFAIGYFHQRQDLYTSKKSETEGVSQ